MLPREEDQTKRKPKKKKKFMRPGFSPVVEIILTKTLDNVAAARAPPQPSPDDVVSPCCVLRPDRRLNASYDVQSSPATVHLGFGSAARRDQRTGHEQLCLLRVNRSAGFSPHVAHPHKLLAKFGHLSMNSALSY